MNLNAKLRSATPRQEWHTQLVRPAHSSFFHLTAEAVTGHKIDFVLGKRPVSGSRLAKS